MKISELKKEIRELNDRVQSAEEGDYGDDYHCLYDLYEHRAMLFLVLCSQTTLHFWKSRLHSDGSSFDGYFVMGLNTEHGKQITYHLQNNFWTLAKCEELDKAPEFDGHSPSDVLDRLLKLI